MLPVLFWTCQLLLNGVVAAAVLPPEQHALTPVCRYTFDRSGDLDLDDQPDDWIRRKGLGFPHYVQAAIDKTTGSDDDRSLRFQADGAGAVYYSPLIPIDGLHTYYFSAAIRTEGMQQDAGCVSISFLNHRRQRVQRFLSKPVLGTHRDWVKIQLDRLTPLEDVRFAVIGCHLIPGASDVRDIGGQIWFDELTLGRLPRMEVESNFYRHFVDGNSPIQVHCKVSGLDPGHQYELEFHFHDLDDQELASERLPLEENQELANRELTDYLEPQPVTWTVPPQPPGFYSSTAVLLRDRIPVASQATSLVIVALVKEPAATGEFGWSIGQALTSRGMAELPQVAVQAGVNAIKYPVWQSGEVADSAASNEPAELFGQLAAVDITPIALLPEPPARIRQQFARNWHGVNEVLSLPPEFWESSLEPVIARFSSSVRHWQLGGEHDRSFLGSIALPQTIQQVRQRVQRISLNAELGIPWDWESAPPRADLQFLGLSLEHPSSPTELSAVLKAAQQTEMPKWLLLRLAHLSPGNHQEQAAQLAQWMLAAKLSRIPRIFLDDVYHDQYGLLNTDGSPRRMFIPWRTVALQLQGAEYLGTFTLPNRSPNAVFAKQGRALIMLWNSEPVEERLFLGSDPRELDLWGRRRGLVSDTETSESIVTADSTPKFLVDGSEALARWRIGCQFELGKMPSAYGGHDDALLIKNTFTQGVSGQVTLNLPDDWEAEPRTWNFALEAGESVRLPTHLRLPANASLGEQPTSWDFSLSADRNYQFRVHRDYTVGLDDLQIEVSDRKLPDGRLEIEQVVTNRTNPLERLDFRCNLFVPDARRQKLQITKLGNGVDRKFYYLPNADAYRGRELWLRLEQEGGRRVLNYRWKVGADW